MAMIDLNDTLISDLHKDARGYRPRNLPQYMEEVEFTALWDGLIEELDEGMERDRRRNLKAQRTLEEALTMYQTRYNISRGDALRWVWEAEGDEDGDVGYWMYNTGITYDLEASYMAELQAEGIRCYSSAY